MTAEQSELPHLRVMLADDHMMVREGLANLLRDEFDMELVGEATDGLQALEMAKATEPDVILMDVNMPRLNGIEATRRIKQSLPCVHIIGLSMHQESDMAQAMRKAGAADYLSKDAPGLQIVRAIRAASHLK